MLGVTARIAMLAMFAAIAGCTTPSGVRPHGPPGEVPLLRLAPAALPGGLAEEQRLAFDWQGRTETIDALVEVDIDQVRVVMHSQGQVAMKFTWDGERLDETRADWLPPQLTGERVLSDLQLVHWPEAAVRAALPPGWSFGGQAGSRTLVHGDEIVSRVTRDGLRTVLSQNRHGYVLTIDSRPVTP